MWQLARTLDLPALLDAHLPGRPAQHDGLTAGQSLTLAAVGRACQATSKRGFAQWAQTTTLGGSDGAAVDFSCLTSQHFWDQMHRVPVAVLAKIETAGAPRTPPASVWSGRS